MTATTRRISISALVLSLALLVVGAAVTVQGQKTKSAKTGPAPHAAPAKPAIATRPAAKAAQTAKKPARKALKPPARATQRLNLNTATMAQLDELPGVGPKTAQRIIDYRQKIGGFQKIEQLMNVRGVGEKNFLRIKDRITVGPGKPASRKS